MNNWQINNEHNYNKIDWERSKLEAGLGDVLATQAISGSTNLSNLPYENENIWSNLVS
jgi:hypothetical protein